MWYALTCHSWSAVRAFSPVAFPFAGVARSQHFSFKKSSSPRSRIDLMTIAHFSLGEAFTSKASSSSSCSVPAAAACGAGGATHSISMR